MNGRIEAARKTVSLDLVTFDQSRPLTAVALLVLAVHLHTNNYSLAAKAVRNSMGQEPAYGRQWNQPPAAASSLSSAADRRATSRRCCKIASMRCRQPRSPASASALVHRSISPTCRSLSRDELNEVTDSAGDQQARAARHNHYLLRRLDAAVYKAGKRCRAERSIHTSGRLWPYGALVQGQRHEPRRDGRDGIMTGRPPWSKACRRRRSPRCCSSDAGRRRMLDVGWRPSSAPP